MATPAKPSRNRYKVAEVRQQLIDAVGGDEVEIELPDGVVVTIPHPLFFSKALKDELKPLDEEDSEALARVLLSPADFTTWEESGQDFDDLVLVLSEVRTAMTDQLAGRKRPTRS